MRFGRSPCFSSGFWLLAPGSFRRASQLAALCLVLFLSHRSFAQDIVAGPMIGAVTDKSARIWMQLAEAKAVTVTTFEIGKGQVSQVTVDVEGPLPFVADIPVNGLAPSKNYRIEVKLDDQKVNLPGPELIISTAPAAGREAAFSMALGSNLPLAAMKGKNSAPIFKEIEKLAPRGMLFLGNIGTLPLKLDDWPKTNRQAVRMVAEAHAKLRKEPDLQPLFRTMPTYTVWNDLDYGIPGADRTWIYQKESFSAFQRFWPNPDWGEPEKENLACYFKFTLGDVDFFMLDSRMFRDPESDPSRKTMLGEKQLEWLKNGLKESTATFKIIGCGSRMLASDKHGDTWSTYPEQKDFIAWLFENRIEGILFVSGGHMGEINAIKPGGGGGKGYPLIELTTGQLLGKPLENAPDGAHRQGSAILDPNFATLDFGGQHEHRFVTLKLRDAKGAVKVEQTIFAPQLK